MQEQKFKAKDKKVSRMSRDGMVEENLATGDVNNVSNREKEAIFKKSMDEITFGKRDESLHRKKAQARAPDGSGTNRAEVDTNSKESQKPETGAIDKDFQSQDSQSDKLRESAITVKERRTKHRYHYHNQRQAKSSRLQFDALEKDGSLGKQKSTQSAPGIDNTVEPDFLKRSEKKAEKAQAKLKHARKKQMRKTSLKLQRVYQEDVQTVKYQLHFETAPKSNEPNGVVKKAGTRFKDSAGNLVHNKIRQEEQNNSAVQAVHKTEQAGESVLRRHSNRTYRRQGNNRAVLTAWNGKHIEPPPVINIRNMWKTTRK